MARGVNKWHGIGNCTKDPETRYMPSGGAVTNISIACNNSYKDKQTGDKVETVEYINIVLFNQLAEIAGKYLTKGGQVYVEGSLRTRKWQDKNGVDRYTTEIVANEMQMLGSKQEGAAPQQQSQAAKDYKNKTQGSMPADDGFDDDIQF